MCFLFSSLDWIFFIASKHIFTYLFKYFNDGLKSLKIIIKKFIEISFFESKRADVYSRLFYMSIILFF